MTAAATQRVYLFAEGDKSMRALLWAKAPTSPSNKMQSHYIPPTTAIWLHWKIFVPVPSEPKAIFIFR